MNEYLFDELLHIVNEVGDSNVLTNKQASNILEIFCKCNRIKFEDVLTKNEYKFEGPLFDDQLTSLFNDKVKFMKFRYILTVSPVLNFLVSRLVLLELSDKYKITGKLNSDNIAWVSILDSTTSVMLKVIAFRNVCNNFGGLTVKYFVTEVPEDYLLKTMFPIGCDRIGSYATNFAVHVYKDDLYTYTKNSLDLPSNFDEAVLERVFNLYINKKYKFDIKDVVSENRVPYINKVICRTFKRSLKSNIKSIAGKINNDDINSIVYKTLNTIPSKFRMDAESISVLQEHIEDSLLNDKSIRKFRMFDEKYLDIMQKLLNGNNNSRKEMNLFE